VANTRLISSKSSGPEVGLISGDYCTSKTACNGMQHT